MIQKDGAGLSTGDSTKYQDWSYTFSQPTRLDGPVSLTIWLAAKDFKTDETIGLEAALELCSPSCTRLATDSWSGSGQSSFRSTTLDFGSIDITASPGSRLKIRVVVPDNRATTDIWFAYDTTSYPSALRVN